MKNRHAVALGKMTSEKKAAAVRENGKKGGRPAGRISAEKAHLIDCHCWSSPKGWFLGDHFLGKTVKDAFLALLLK